MKKVFNVFLGIIIFIGLLGAGILIGGRNVLSGQNMTKIVNAIVKEENGSNSITDDLFDEIDQVGFKDYVDEKKLEKAMGSYISSYFKMSAGVVDEMDSSELSDILKDAAKEYNKDHKEKIDTKEIDDALKEVDKQLEDAKIVDKEVQEVFKVLYNNKILLVLIGIVVILLLIIYFVNKSLKVLFFHLGLTSLLSGLIIKFGSSTILNYALNDSSFENHTETVENIFNAIGTIGLIGIICGIVFIVISIILGRVNKTSSTPVAEEINESYEEPREEYVTKDLVPDAEETEIEAEDSNE